MDLDSGPAAADAPVADALFAYGSLIWRPGFTPTFAHRAALPDHARRFWQASHDHRGTPGAPGRVVTLVPAAGEPCRGLVLGLPKPGRGTLLAALDERERDGYVRVRVRPVLDDGSELDAITWVAHAGNPSWAGEDPDVAALVATRAGPSGTNAEYLFELARALREHEVVDPHIEALEREVRSRADGRS